MIDTRPESLTLGRLETPIGTALLVTDEGGVLRAFNWTDYEPQLRGWLDRRYVGIPISEGESPAAGTFGRYFGGDPRALEGLAYKALGTRFQLSVWEALMAIPAGETWSYRDIAARIGRPTAVRAVGLANGANPLAVIVPCHRVIGANGALTGYGGGLSRKQWLLDHERAWAKRLANCPE